MSKHDVQEKIQNLLKEKNSMKHITIERVIDEVAKVAFSNISDYYLKNSCKQFIPAIKTKSLLINALDDPFLTPECYPIIEAKNNSFFHLETPKYGGHVGFVTYLNITKQLWCENRILTFIEEGI